MQNFYILVIHFVNVKYMTYLSGLPRMVLIIISQE